MSADDKVSLRAWVAVTGGLFGCFMAGMNVHVTSAALPEIEGALGATFEEGSWISTAYLVAEISMIPLTAWLVEVFSLRRVMLLGSLVFLLSSLSCALAPNLSTLILIRVIQGASGAVLIPLSMQLILTELPSSRIPLGMALFSLSNSVAQAAGPSIGGWLADIPGAGSFSCNCCRGSPCWPRWPGRSAPATATANACARPTGSASARWSPASARCR